MNRIASEAHWERVQMVAWWLLTTNETITVVSPDAESAKRFLRDVEKLANPFLPKEA